MNPQIPIMARRPNQSRRVGMTNDVRVISILEGHKILDRSGEFSPYPTEAATMLTKEKYESR